MKTYIVDIKGIVIPENEWEYTTIWRQVGKMEYCKIEFNKSDIVETKEDKENKS